MGQGIRRAIDEGLVKREDLFVVSKLWCTFHAKEHVPIAIARTLADLGKFGLSIYDIKLQFEKIHLLTFSPSLVCTCRISQDWTIWICTSFTFQFL